MDPRNARFLAFAVLATVLVLLLSVFSILDLPKGFYAITAVAFAVALAVALWLLVHCAAENQTTRAVARQFDLEGHELRLQYSFFRKVAGLPQKFSYKALEAATDDFGAQLGRGGSGTVFKGILDDGTPVAVKRIDGADCAEREFRSEISVIAGAQHVNLVRLLGYCLLPGGPNFLVYEFVMNGSLDRWIFPRKEHGPRRCLSWRLRYQVAVDVAKALAYLHCDCRSRVLHLDIKPENILLDEDFHAVVSDFGLAKLMARNQSRVVATVRGTKGYLAPEWLLDSGITEKSDIYSYGMVLLELIGGRRNVQLVGDGSGASQRKWSYFPKTVMDKVRKGMVMDVVDKRLMEGGESGGGVDVEQVRTMVYVALWCIQETVELRPPMPRVVDMLEGRLPVQRPPETDMIIVDLLSVDDDQTSHGSRRLLGVGVHGTCAGGGGGATAWEGSQASEGQTSSSTYSLGLSMLSGR